MNLCDELQAVTWCRRLEDLPQIPHIELGFTGVDKEPPVDLVFARQVHGALLLEASAAWQGQRPEADGVFTKDKGVAVAVQTADCLPILFAGNRTVMAVHAGWRGVARGIIMNAAGILTAAGESTGAAHVFIGPAIGLLAFEIGYEVIEAIQEGCLPLRSEELAFCLMKGVEDRWHFDLQTAAVLTLLKCGIPARSLTVVRQCTFASGGEWHSYRRQKQEAGRNWAWIKFKG